MMNIINLSALKSILVSLKNKLPAIMAGYVAREMNKGKARKKPYFRTSDKLENQSGKLWRSFFRAGETITNIDLSGWKISGQFGSDLPYASVHEKGMFVASKGKMHRYFWAKYFETGYEWYKIMALSVLKRGGINIKARPYFEKAMKEFQRDGLPKIIDGIINSLRTA